jgi:hypothetical protein
MKVLFLHPEDTEAGPWSHERWNHIFDLGFSGPSTYARWSAQFSCPVEPLSRLAPADMRAIRDTLSIGLGQMMDGFALDWWELISIRFHEQLERILRLEKLAARIGPGDEVRVSRAGPHARLLELLLGRNLHCFLPANSLARRLRRGMGIAAKFKARELAQILGDKYDSGYRLRRLVTPEKRDCKNPVVLLPTAYVNASRAELAYASALPDRDFLLVATRQSGWIASQPKNVNVARLAAYASGRYDQREYKSLLKRWHDLQPHLIKDRELATLKELGTFDSVPFLLREGLAIRNAWLQVLDSEPVASVLCADDSNPYTHLPLLIARERGLPAMACHHGALDGRYLVKRSHADRILVKGRMEWDYLVQTCGVERERIEIAAPPRKTLFAVRGSQHRNVIVFFSEPYEVAEGRPIAYYREVLPKLADLAAKSNRELVVKLHPQESLRERRRLVNAVLSSAQRRVTHLVEGPLEEQLMASAWCAATVQSTAAVDCTLQGIPVFLCGCLDHSNYGYIEQFVKFGVGVRLGSADDITDIPRWIECFAANDSRDLWEPAAPARLEQFFSRRPLMAETALA